METIFETTKSLVDATDQMIDDAKTVFDEAKNMFDAMARRRFVSKKTLNGPGNIGLVTAQMGFASLTICFVTTQVV